MLRANITRSRGVTSAVTLQAKHNIVICPGHLCNARLFAHQIEGLSDIASLQVLDLYGYDSVADLAIGALASAPPDFILLANSMGGAVAFEIMRRASARVQALALVGTTCRAEFQAQSERRAQAITLVEQEDWPALAKLYAPIFFHPENRIERPSLDLTLEHMIRDATGQGISRQQRAFSSRPYSFATLAQIRCPALVVCGREDAITPLALSEEIAHGIRGSELKIVEHCGHVPTIERPVETTGIIRAWLGRVAGRGSSA